MTVYLLAMLLSIGLTYLGVKRPEYKWLRYLGALPLAVVAAARWGVGTDMYYLYLPQFRAVEWVRGGGGAELAQKLFQPLVDGVISPPLVGAPVELAEMFWTNFNLEELGYRALVESIVWCGGSFRWFTVISSLATTALIFAVIWRQSRMPALAVYFYVMTSNYFLALNIVRQYFAIGLVLLAVSFAVDRRIWSFLLSVLVAALFHKSAVLALPVWLLPRIRFSPLWGLVCTAASLGISVVAAPLLKMILPLVGLGIYTKYFESGHAADGFEGIFFAINLAFMVMGIWYYRRAVAGTRFFRVWYWMTVLGTMALSLSGTVPLMKRINYYFAAPQFLMLPEMFLAEANPRLRRWLTWLAVLAFAAETVVAVGLMNKNEPLPYHVLEWGGAR